MVNWLCHNPSTANGQFRQPFLGLVSTNLTAELTDVMVRYEGSEAFRETVWVQIEELKRDGWHMSGRPFAGPASLMGCSAVVARPSSRRVASQAGTVAPTTREEWKAVAPVIPPA
jgi:4-oxalocrotonate tautomerase